MTLERPKHFSDEYTQIAVDFDKVIHASSRGYHDGTIYDNPLPGARDALEMLARHYQVVVYTCKARSDRPLVQGKTGVQLVWDWLEQNDLAQFVHEVASEKPRAVAYIDDKAVRFTSWGSCIHRLKEIGLLE